jgi:hypothetical protein
MTRLLAALFGVALFQLAAVALARDLPPVAEPNESQLERHGHYKNRTGEIVHQPSKSLNGEVPTGASARCRDGSYSFSRHSSGTCSGHGGVGSWLH